MLIAGAVCPHPPLLIPAALGGAAAVPPAGLREVLGACDRAVRGLLETRPDLVVVVGGGPVTREFDVGAAGSLHEPGRGATAVTGQPVLPLSLTVGRWLLARAGLEARGSAAHQGAGVPAGGERRSAGRSGGGRRPGARVVTEARGAGPATSPGLVLHSVAARAAPADCRRLGMALAERSARVAMLAMGDASACRAQPGTAVPGAVAQDYDDEVAEALAAADARWLGALDPTLDDELAVTGRAAWQVLAGAASTQRFHGRLLCMAAPYEVTYLVATWDTPGAG